MQIVVLKLPGSMTLEEVCKLTEPQLMSPSARWYLGTEMTALIFVAFLLGLKVLLVISFTVVYVHRWWDLRQVN